MTAEHSLLPVFFKMSGRPCLVVGGGRIALEKIHVLLRAGTEIRVVARDLHPEVEHLAREGVIAAKQKEYASEDLEGTTFVIAATNDRELNHRIYGESQSRGCLVNVVDDPEYCDFYFGSIVRRGSLQIAISTTGESPAFAQQLRGEIDAALPGDVGDWLQRVGELRRHVNTVVGPGPRRTELLRELARRETCDPANCPCRALVASGAE